MIEYGFDEYKGSQRGKIMISCVGNAKSIQKTDGSASWPTVSELLNPLNWLQKVGVALLLLLAFAHNSYAAQPSSFNEIRGRMYETPLTTLPQHPGLKTWDVISSLMGSEDNPNAHGLIVRSRVTLVDTADERTPEPKWLHPRGACAEARWVITEDSPYTGLFAQGTDVPAIVRISSGTGDSEYSDSPDYKGRILGMAIKLYPTDSKTHKVLSRNIVTLDQYGFESSTRKHTFWENDNATPVYFTNVAPAKSALGKFLSAFFDRFDNPNWARPLYQVARANFGGGELIEYRTPYEVRYQIQPKLIDKKLKTYGDFRSELVDLKNVDMDIILQSHNGKDVIAKKIGVLKFGSFVVSDYCDLKLHFHHSSIEDQWEKYNNYEMVESLANPQ